MSVSPIVHAPAEWAVALELRPRLAALLAAESRHSGRSLNDIVTEAVANFLRAHPVSLR